MQQSQTKFELPRLIPQNKKSLMGGAMSPLPKNMKEGQNFTTFARACSRSENSLTANFPTFSLGNSGLPIVSTVRNEELKKKLENCQHDVVNHVNLIKNNINNLNSVVNDNYYQNNQISKSRIKVVLDKQYQFYNLQANSTQSRFCHQNQTLLGFSDKKALSTKFSGKVTHLKDMLKLALYDAEDKENKEYKKMYYSQERGNQSKSLFNESEVDLQKNLFNFKQEDFDFNEHKNLEAFRDHLKTIGTSQKQLFEKLKNCQKPEETQKIINEQLEHLLKLQKKDEELKNKKKTLKLQLSSPKFKINQKQHPQSVTKSSMTKSKFFDANNIHPFSVSKNQNIFASQQLSPTKSNIMNNLINMKKSAQII